MKMVTGKRPVRNNLAVPFSFSKGMVLLHRWSIFACMLLLYLVRIERTPLMEFVFSLAGMYNLLVSYRILSVKRPNKNMNYLILLIDSVAISAFIAISGGPNSEAYIAYYFIAAYCAFYVNKKKMIVNLTFNVMLFTAASLVSARISGVKPDYILILLKDVYILLFSQSVVIINNKIRKFNEIHLRESKLARTDSLTGLANRHHFEQRLRDEADYVDMTSGVLNVLMFDIDNFKQFNDKYGHLPGDELLIMFADIIRQNIRKEDLAIRYGGEEFLILIRNLELDLAVSVAERIRRQLEKKRIQFDINGIVWNVTASCGIAQYPVHSNNIFKVIEYADKALYYAKSMGKNSVVTYDQILSDANRQGK